MKFRMFTQNGGKLAINVDSVAYVGVVDGRTRLYLRESKGSSYYSDFIEVDEDFDTVFSRLNTVAE